MCLSGRTELTREAKCVPGTLHLCTPKGQTLQNIHVCQRNCEANDCIVQKMPSQLASSEWVAGDGVVCWCVLICLGAFCANLCH